MAADQPFIEEAWHGHHIMIGQDVMLHVIERLPRCRTVDVAQDGTDPRHRLLPKLTKERDGLLAIYTDVVTSGSIAIGDPVDVRADAADRRDGGSPPHPEIP